MSRRGNCHDNAVAESFFSSLKRERIRCRTYKTRKEARQDVFDYIEMFYSPVRKQVRNGMLSPAEFERQQILKAEGVQKTRGYSFPSISGDRRSELKLLPICFSGVPNFPELWFPSAPNSKFSKVWTICKLMRKPLMKIHVCSRRKVN
jgi:putative transposase